MVGRSGTQRRHRRMIICENGSSTLDGTGHVNAVVPASIEAVWKVLTDVTRVGE